MKWKGLHVCSLGSANYYFHTALVNKRLYRQNHFKHFPLSDVWSVNNFIAEELFSPKSMPLSQCTKWYKCIILKWVLVTSDSLFLLWWIVDRVVLGCLQGASDGLVILITFSGCQIWVYCHCFEILRFLPDRVTKGSSDIGYFYIDFSLSNHEILWLSN